ncbi:hypothetical protein F1643_21600 [Azospirillum sp. INR13]|uniref:hypothetical protein n=1 Tax=Azospirillum sp. INR13 TaxID=2596919 RepID=UPI001892069C|nr:hypothetical protein [Azospirillum sp. INR13]MBF5096587.1 hypothetical protein [Azospirillum sp. INR13]
MRLVLLAVLLTLTAAEARADVLRYSCRFVAGDHEREASVDTFVADSGRNRADLWMSRANDGWKYAPGDQYSADSAEVLIDPEWVSVSAMRMRVPVAISLERSTGRLVYVYVTGTVTKHFEYNCVPR